MAKAQAERDKFWSYVTVFGTLWGSLELTLGTFLHVLHVPKTGFIMCMLSILLLIAQRKIYPVRGSSICAAIVAACIKCLSPGGIIAGPVFGILSEALVVELALLVSSTALPAAMIAGALTLTWSQIQSVVKIWIYYGQDFIDGLAKLISKFFEIEWTSALGWGLLGLFFGITSICGALAGLFGSKLGSSVLREISSLDSRKNSLETPSNASKSSPSSDAQAPSDTVEQPHSAPKDAIDILTDLKGSSKRRKPDEITLKSRALLAPIALATLIVQLPGELAWSALAFVIWIAALFLKARPVLKAIWWPKFWALTLTISILGGLILAWDISGNWAWLTGLEATARMMIRGCYVFSLITWATRAIRPQEVLSFWNKIHLPGLGIAITHAYQILPKWIDLMNDMLKKRPKGKRATLKYIRQCFLSCLIQASLDSQDFTTPSNNAY
ncbi:MAG: hypothetical protein IJ165_11455 [Proteobacteria bacterium]|nr:hypothetical protein [Pseudomonadota bacterium]